MFGFGKKECTIPFRFVAFDGDTLNGTRYDNPQSDSVYAWVSEKMQKAFVTITEADRAAAKCRNDAKTAGAYYMAQCDEVFALRQKNEALKKQLTIYETSIRTQSFEIEGLEKRLLESEEENSDLRLIANCFEVRLGEMRKQLQEAQRNEAREQGDGFFTKFARDRVDEVIRETINDNIRAALSRDSKTPKAPRAPTTPKAASAKK